MLQSLYFLAATLAAPTSAQPVEGIAFFEAKIRPVLVEHCYECHSAQSKKVRGGLLADHREGLLKGGDTGPAVVPGHPEKSLLVEALRHAGLRMPPKGRLPASVIADVETWIRLGAPDPRVGSAVKRAPDGPYDFEAAGRHWAFQPIRKVAPPAGSAANPVDRFVAARLTAIGLTPAAPADRRTWLRRVYVDLIGLPPTAEEIEAFESATGSDPHAGVVDRLLASPHYGERWARHWLDVARYADTKDGVLMYGDDRIRPFAYTYRDYVIRAFNEDVPFDRFIHDQLAADRLVDDAPTGTPGPDAWRLAALGFLTLGRQFDNNVHDIIDDRIDVVTRGLLGLTVACARCHNHKYDPVPMADYYGLYGVFAGAEQPLELPLLADPASVPGGAAFEKQASARRQELKTFLESQYALLSEQARQRVTDYLVRVATTPPDPLESAIYFLSLAPQDLRPPLVARWRRYLDVHARPEDPVFGLWSELMAAGDDLAKRAPAILEQAAARAPAQVNPLVLDALRQARPSNRGDVARAYGELLRRVYDESRKFTKADDSSRQQLLTVLTGRDSPAYFPRSQTRRYMSRSDTDSFGRKLVELDRMTVKTASAPPRAMVLVDTPEPYEPRLFLRGNPVQLGDRVPRQFLRIVAGPNRTPFRDGSGRLDLARAITDPANPLTARVLVNRVWMHHFGEPLVATPSDFGIRSSPPSHPELLDWLAATFVEDGWSLKKLHRRLVLSATYRQASLDRPECRKLDPENRLLWRMNRRRLDLEAMRDTLLLVSGQLDRTMGGRAVEVARDAQNRRRTVYGLVDRQSLPGLFRAFDFAQPDQSIERRPQTTVPQQALFGMNAPFVLEQARAVAERPEVTRATTVEARVTALYRVTLGRHPTEDERRRTSVFLSESTDQNALAQLAQVLLLTNEMMFVD